ncbi:MULTISPECIES: histidine kinase [Rhodonellum]|nr:MULTISPECIES: histidine kinase [Rhodonellum]
MELSRALNRSRSNDSVQYLHAQNAIDLALQLDDTLLYARALDNLGLLYRYHQQYSDAGQFHSKAFSLIEHKPYDPLYKMIFANNAGLASRYDQSYDKAVYFYLKALNIAESQKDLKNIAISCNGLGNTFSQIPSKENESLEYFERSLDAEEKRNNPLGMAMNYLSISDHYIGKQQFDISREYLNKLLKLNEARKDKFGLAITYEYFGHSYLAENKNSDLAINYYQRSLTAFEELNNKHKVAGLLSNLGQASLRVGQTHASKNYYLKSLELAKEINNKALIMQSAKGLADVSEKLADYKNSLLYTHFSNQYKDSINLFEQETQIAAITRQYDLEKKESQIVLLEKNRNLQEAELKAQTQKFKTQQAFLILIAVVLIALIITSILVLRDVKNKKKTTQLLQQKEKERVEHEYKINLLQAEMLATRMQMNPHFLFNCLNAVKYLIQTENYFKAKDYLIVFSKFVRLVLETSQKQVIPIEEELGIVCKYLKLEENRFDQSFLYQVNNSLTDAVSKEVMLPPMLLQPFVENSIWHGLLPSNKAEKVIAINISGDLDQIKVEIVDNGVGRKINSRESSSMLHKSMGTRITQDRINLFNKTSNYTISFKINDILDAQKLSGTKVVILLQAT